MKTRGANNCENMSKNEVEITPKSLKNEPWNSIKNDAQKHTPKNRKIRQNDAKNGPPRRTKTQKKRIKPSQEHSQKKHAKKATTLI